MNLDEAILYRMAYGLAQDLAEATQDVLAGRHRRNPAAGGSAQRINAEVVRRLNVGDADQALVAEAVADALEKRRPRW